MRRTTTLALGLRRCQRKRLSQPERHKVRAGSRYAKAPEGALHKRLLSLASGRCPMSAYSRYSREAPLPAAVPLPGADRQRTAHRTQPQRGAASVMPHTPCTHLAHALHMPCRGVEEVPAGVCGLSDGRRGAPAGTVRARRKVLDAACGSRSRWSLRALRACVLPRRTIAGRESGGRQRLPRAPSPLCLVQVSRQVS